MPTTIVKLFQNQTLDKKTKMHVKTPTNSQLNIRERTDEDAIKNKTKPARPVRIRTPIGRRGHTTRTKTIQTHRDISVNRSQSRRRGSSETTTPSPTSTTTEKITVSPNAHKISYTLDDSEYTVITSASPILPEHISELNNIYKEIPSQPQST